MRGGNVMIENEKEKYESLLNITEMLIKRHQREKRKNGGDFNIFNILDKKSAELSHEKFIFDLINPKGSHSQDTKFLKLFLENVLEILDFDFENSYVEQERPIKSMNTNGRIDLFIESKDYIIAIEIKIYAKEQENQIARYQKYIEEQKNGRKSKVYYLTLFGEDSNTVDKKSEIECKSISFKEQIIEWTKLSIEKAALFPKIREVLYQYLDTIMNLTNILEGGLEMELTELLLKNKNIQYAEELYEAVGEAKAIVECEFWLKLNNEISMELNELGFVRNNSEEEDDWDITKKNIKKIRQEKKNAVGISYGKEEMRIQVLQWNCSNFVFWVGFLDDEEIDKNILNKIEEKGIDKKDEERGRYIALNNELCFTNDSFYKLLEKDGIDVKVKEISSEIKEFLKNIEEIIK